MNEWDMTGKDFRQAGLSSLRRGRRSERTNELMEHDRKDFRQAGLSSLGRGRRSERMNE